MKMGWALVLLLAVAPACMAAGNAAGNAAGDAAFATALRQAQSGNCEAAASTLTNALRAHPLAGRDHYRLLSDCQLRLGKAAEAVQSLRNGLRKFPAASPTLQKSLGQLLFRQTPESLEAGTLLASAAKALPRDAELLHYYGQWAYLNSRDRVCVDQERAALRLPGLNDLALLQMNTMLGMCASRLEEASIAHAAFQAAHEINERQSSFDPIAAYQYLTFLGRFGDTNGIVAIVDDILMRLPRFGPALLERAKLRERAKEYPRAIEAAMLALDGTNNDINSERAAHGILAKSYFVLADQAAAQREQEWINAHPNPETPQR